MSQWYVLAEAEPRSAAENMAVDQHLLMLLEAGELKCPVLRLYGWSKPTVSLGYHQRLAQVVDLKALHAHDLDLVRRWTGGRAVLHDHDEITYAVIAPTREPFNQRVSHNYCLIGKALQRFTDLGHLSGRMQTGAEDVAAVRAMRHAPCFASLSTAEIEQGGRKLIGSAQKVGRGAFLQHGSIPMVHRPHVLEAVTGTRLDMSTFMTSISEHYAEAGLSLPNRAALYDRLVAAFAAAFAVEFNPLTALELPDMRAVAEIRDSRFASREWTHRK